MFHLMTDPASWSPWSFWSGCSSPCGTRYRIRRCNREVPTANCDGNEKEERGCKNTMCEGKSILMEAVERKQNALFTDNTKVMATIGATICGLVGLLLLGAAATIIYVLRKRTFRRFAPVSQEGHELQPICDGAVATTPVEEHTENIYDVYGSEDDITRLGEDIIEVSEREPRITTPESDMVSYENVVQVEGSGQDVDSKSVISFYADEVVVGDIAGEGSPIPDGAVDATPVEEHVVNLFAVYGSKDNIAIWGEDINKVGGREARITTPESEGVSYENVVQVDGSGRDTDQKSVLSFYADEVVVGGNGRGGRQ